MGMSDNNSPKSPVPGGSLAKPVLVALGALLVGRMLSGKHDETNEAQTIEPPVQPQTEDNNSGGLLGAVLGGLGGLLASAAGGAAASTPTAGGTTGLGGVLSGGLGGLLDQLTQAGHGSKVESWLGQGENAAIQPDELGSAIGQKTLSEIAQQAGVNEQELLAQLSNVLPGVIDKLTANGKVPDMHEIAQLLQKQP
ncbi:uncharacterized protein YidB (DUF937 family) [Paenochrobactrum gallinarii]|uniref:Uncharacterized protein YidB (DUF937 family) n=1 Tax=Paenochrobactrum gallinarii TaxID=643673 RepID=A0A841M6A1_9HYPH|nr:YidB family protein [Paenochrobactrum gallinarii]MBB6261791.1 uncharacterized protein YidB (DUF937 family) [Paenochrobactrum gallinarii]